PDVYDNLEMTKNTFVQFFAQSQHLVLCEHDPVIRSLFPTLIHPSIVTYGLDDTADYYAQSIIYSPDETTFEVYKKGNKLGNCKTELFGEKNVLNTLGIITLLLENKFSFEETAQSVEGFKGAKRRFELVWTDTKSFLFDDYGHHPSEIEATIKAVRSRFPTKKLHVLFQPHTYSRTAAFRREFARALSQADYVYIMPIFASAREKKEQFDVSSSAIAHEAKNNHVIAFENTQETLRSLGTFFHKGDVILTMGAGDIYKLKDDIIDILNENSI
ncbi:MAG: cyanophycin synthetase, partial [bacterium]